MKSSVLIESGAEVLNNKRFSEVLSRYAEANDKTVKVDKTSELIASAHLTSTEIPSIRAPIKEESDV